MDFPRRTPLLPVFPATGEIVLVVLETEGKAIPKVSLFLRRLNGNPSGNDTPCHAD